LISQAGCHSGPTALEAAPDSEAVKALWNTVLHGGIEEISALLSDHVVIVDPLGRTWSKQDLITSWYEGTLSLETMIPESQYVQSYEALTSTTTVCRMSGALCGKHFSGLFRHILVLMYTSSGLQVVSGGICRLTE
jgi:Domain of unknown function (DUF4440)